MKFNEIKVGDRYEGAEAQGKVYAKTDLTVSIDTGEPLAFPYPYGATRKVTLCYWEFKPENFPR